MAGSQNGRAGGRPESVPLPPTGPQRPLMVLRAPIGSRVTVVALNDFIHGAVTHWLDGRELPCSAMWGQPCDPCRRKGPPPRWSAWFGAWERNSSLIRLCCITQGGYAHCKQLQAEQGNMRGLQLSLGRSKLTAQAPVTVRVLDRYDGKLPDPPDVPAALMLLWQIKPTPPADADEA